VNGQQLSSHDMIERYAAMVDRYPIWSIEDGLGESDRDGWRKLTARLGDRVQLVGDDNFCTNPAIITTAIADGIANAALIKLNQVGTVSETLEAMAICHRAGYTQMVSHRSGETPTPSSPTWRWAPGAARSRPEHPPAVRGSPSTTGSSRSAPTTRTCHTVRADAEVVQLGRLRWSELEMCSLVFDRVQASSAFRYCRYRSQRRAYGLGVERLGLYAKRRRPSHR